MNLIVTALSFLVLVSEASVVKKEISCPNCSLENCRWEISTKKNLEQVEVRWDKGVISHHTEKPFASPLECNVDRNFGGAKNGYIKVWFKEEKEPCEVKQGSDPFTCGVSFVFHAVESQFPIGFNVQAPVGKTLSKVEHLSTLDIQCGNLSKEGAFTSEAWNALVGWEATRPGDGTYSLSF